MSHASPKRSRQEPGHRMDHHPRNHKRILEDYEDSVVARMPKKGVNVNADVVIPWLEWQNDALQYNTFARLPCTLACEEPGYLNASEIKLHNLKYNVDKKVITISEDSSLWITSPVFRASVTVEIPPIPEGAHYEVGWIQVVTDMKIIFKHGEDGICSFEIPELETGKFTMFSDSDGSMYPWYGSMSEMASLQGPTDGLPSFATLSMTDFPETKIAWTSFNSVVPNLTYVYKKQRFYSFIAIKDVNTGICQIIERLTWVAEYAIDVNPKKPLGQRCRLLGPREQDIPRITSLYLTPSLDQKGLNPPICNRAQVVTWKPRIGDIEVIIPLDSTYVNIDMTILKSAEDNYELARVSRMKYL